MSTPLLEVTEDVSWVGLGFKLVKRIVPGRLADFDPYGPYMVPRYVLPPDWAGTDYLDGEWHATVGLPHEAVEHEGKVVPLYEETPAQRERREWAESRSGRRCFRR